MGEEEDAGGWGMKVHLGITEYYPVYYEDSEKPYFTEDVEIPENLIENYRAAKAAFDLALWNLQNYLNLETDFV